MYPRLPPPPQPLRHHDPYHLCNHPSWHRVALGAVVVSWAAWALCFGLPMACGLSRHFGPGINLLMYVVFGMTWLVIAIPAGAAFLYTLVLGKCNVTIVAYRKAPNASTRERIILSPDAARECLGVHGEVILERETSQGHPGQWE